MKHLLLSLLLLLAATTFVHADEYWLHPVWGSRLAQVRIQESDEHEISTPNAGTEQEQTVLSYNRPFWGHDGKLAYYFMNNRLYAVTLEIPHLNLTPDEAKRFFLKDLRPILKKSLIKPEELLAKGSDYVPAGAGAVRRNINNSFASSGLWYNQETLIYLQMDTFSRQHLSITVFDAANPNFTEQIATIKQKAANAARANGYYNDYRGVAAVAALLMAFVFIIALCRRLGIDLNMKIPAPRPFF